MHVCNTTECAKSTDVGLDAEENGMRSCTRMAGGRYHVSSMCKVHSGRSPVSSTKSRLDEVRSDAILYDSDSSFGLSILLWRVRNRPFMHDAILGIVFGPVVAEEFASVIRANAFDFQASATFLESDPFQGFLHGNRLLRQKNGVIVPREIVGDDQHIMLTTDPLHFRWTRQVHMEQLED